MTLAHIREYAHVYVPMATQDAVRYHGGDVRKDGSPYVGHLFRVAAQVADDPAAMVLALLHDVVEDHGDELHPTYLTDRYGAELAALLDALTHRQGQSEPRVAYMDRVIAAGPIARRVKLADLVDNYTHLDASGVPEADRRRLDAKYSAEIKRLAPLVWGDEIPTRPTLGVVDG